MIALWGQFTTDARALPEGVSLVTWLSMCRAHRPKAFLQLVRTDAKAADIAVRKRWHIPEVAGRREQPTPEDEQAVNERVQEAVRVIAEAKRAEPLTQRSSYASIDAMREESIAAADRLRAQQAAVIPKPLPDEVLKAARDADPRVQAARAQQKQILAEQEAERERRAFSWDHGEPEGTA